MIKLIKLLFNFTIYLQFKELFSLLIQFAINQGKSLKELSTSNSFHKELLYFLSNQHLQSSSPYKITAL